MIQKFYNTTRPEPGKERIHYGKADDSKIAYEITHGVNTRPSLVVRLHLVIYIIICCIVSKRPEDGNLSHNLAKH